MCRSVTDNAAYGVNNPSARVLPSRNAAPRRCVLAGRRLPPLSHLARLAATTTFRPAVTRTPTTVQSASTGRILEGKNAGIVLERNAHAPIPVPAVLVHQEPSAYGLEREAPVPVPVGVTETAAQLQAVAFLGIPSVVAEGELR